jgi:putative ABC transport system ATP-binding protein
VNLKVRRGEVVAVMGPSGCGKTTLINCLSGIDVIDGGTIKIAGRDLKDLTDNQRTDFRARQMGFVFQSYNLLPVLSGVENVELPLLVAGIKTSLARKLAEEAIETVGVRDWARHRPAEMSGGQRQRFTIARALATRPAIVWADEPTGALDSENGAAVMELMIQLNKQSQQTFVWVTHSEEVAALAHRLIRMRDGQITSDSPVERAARSLTGAPA